MTRDEFDNANRVLTLLADVLVNLNLQELIDVCERDEAIGCFVDIPAAWMDRRDIMENVKDRARAALAFRNAHAKMLAQAVVEVEKEAKRKEKADG